MNRSEFLKVLGMAVIAPSVLVPGAEGGVVGVPFKPKQWPIYPDVVKSSRYSSPHYLHSFFSYVKINRNGVEYLVPVKECHWGVKNEMGECEKWFEHNVNEIQKNYVVDDFLLERGYILKYNPQIHHDL